MIILFSLLLSTVFGAQGDLSKCTDKIDADGVIEENFYKSSTKVACKAFDSDPSNSCAYREKHLQQTSTNHDYQKDAQSAVDQLLTQNLAYSASGKNWNDSKYTKDLPNRFKKGTPENKAFVDKVASDAKDFQQKNCDIGEIAKPLMSSAGHVFTTVRRTPVPSRGTDPEQYVRSRYRNEQEKILDEYQQTMENQNSSLFCGSPSYLKDVNFRFTGAGDMKGSTGNSDSPWEAGDKTSGVLRQDLICKADLKQKFADNSTKYDVDAMSKDPDLKKCIDDAKAKGMELSQINIKTSSSQVYNTGKASQDCCLKNFECLSKARAESARSDALPEVFAKMYGSDPQMLSTINAKLQTASMDVKGQNGNGSSGACPYRIDEAKSKAGSLVEVEKTNYAKIKTDLEKAKYGEVQVSFIKRLPKDGINQKTKEVDSLSLRCRSLKFECVKQ